MSNPKDWKIYLGSRKPHGGISRLPRRRRGGRIARRSAKSAS